MSTELNKKSVFADLLGNRRSEFWRYSPVQSWTTEAWPQAVSGAPSKTDVQVAVSMQKEASHALHLFLYNGILQKDLSNPFPANWIVQTLGRKSVTTEASRWHKLQAQLAGGYSIADLQLTDLNVSDFQEVLQIEIPAETAAGSLFVHYQGSESALSQPRLRLKLGARAKLDLVQVFVGQQSQWINSALEVEVGDSANLSWLRWTSLGSKGNLYAQSSVTLHDNSELHSLSVQSSAAWARDFHSIFHLGRGSASTVHGTYWARRQQGAEGQMENYTNIDHVVGGCRTEQVYRGLVADQSKAVFNGRIHIRKGALLADTSQLTQTLLLSPQAEINAKPQLEIEADDVKAKHGATIGQLSDDELFYLTSRGIGPTEAKRLIAEGFLIGAVEQYPQEDTRRWTLRRLRQDIGEGDWT